MMREVLSRAAEGVDGMNCCPIPARLLNYSPPPAAAG